MTDLESYTGLDRLTACFREFHRLSLSRYGSYGELYADYLMTGMRLFNMPVGIISRISDDQYHILAVLPDTTGLAVGDKLPLGDTYCSAVISQQSSMAVAHAAKDASFAKHPAYRQMLLESYLAAPIWVEGEIYGTINFTAPEQRERPFDEVDVELIELMAGRIGQVIEQDQTDRQRQEALSRLRENTELFESAFQYAPIGMALVSVEGRWLRVNNALNKIFGYNDSELLSIDFQQLTHPKDLDLDLAFLGEILEGKRDSYRMEKRYFHKNGQQIHALLSVSMVRDEAGEAAYFVSQIQDISAQKRAAAELLERQSELQSLNHQLEVLSTTDPLTQLGNRRELDRRLAEELQRSARSGEALSFVLIDVDHFKGYNDNFGHPAGDLALRSLATELRKLARANDSAIRYGGEEFMLLLPYTDEAGCHAVAQRLSQMVADIAGLQSTITVSTGGVTWQPRPGTKEAVAADVLLKSADQALYRAKQTGRNRHCQAPLV